MTSKSKATHRAAVLVAPRRIELQDISAPTLKPTDALIRVRAAGICGTDLAIHDGHYPVPLPLVLGHEWVGTVEAAGSPGAEKIVGKRVVGEINNHCLATKREGDACCPACASPQSLYNHCQVRTVTGIIKHDGAFAERLVCPARNLRLVPDDAPDEAAILIEPLAAAIQTFKMTTVYWDHTVVVLGCGRLGLLAALVARRLCESVIAFTNREEDVGLAGQFDVDARVVENDEQIVAAVRGATNGLGADVVVEATGSPNGLSLALDCVRPRGTVALKSTPGTPVEQFDLTRVVVDEIGLQGSRCGDFSTAIRFWEEHSPPLEKLVAAEFPLKQIADAIERARQPGKVLLRVKE